MSEYNIFEALVAQQDAYRDFLRDFLNESRHDIDYDDFFNADNRHPEAGETSVQQLINSYE